MQGGKGGRACDIHREPGPSLTPVYNSFTGISGTSNLGFFPPKKRRENLFTLLHGTLTPVLKQVARETRETLVIKFSALSRESISSWSAIHGQKKTKERSVLTGAATRDRRQGVCVRIKFKKKKKKFFHPRMCKKGMHKSKTTRTYTTTG